MKILLTGGAGFIGSAVARIAIQRGHTIVNVDALTYAACINNLKSISNHPNYFFEHADISDFQKIKSIFFLHKPDWVMHLAAETHVDRSIDKPSEFLKTNVIGTYNMLNAALDYWKSSDYNKNFRFHHISTDEVFGSLSIDSNNLFTEQTPYDPRSPYSASKASSDHFVRAWNKTFGLPILITNCSNNYGPYQFPEKLIPVVILNALEEKFIPVYGNGSNIRDWLYVDDHVNALLLVLEKGSIGQSYNIGAKNERTNMHIIKTLCLILDRLRPKKTGSYTDLIKFVDDRPGHDARYAIDPNLIISELGWKPYMSLEKGLEKTVKWYIDNKDWWKSLLNRNGVGQRLGKIK